VTRQARRQVWLRRLRSHDDVAVCGLIGRWGRTLTPARWGDGSGAPRQDWSGVNLFRLHATLDLHVTFHYRPMLTTRPRRRVTTNRRPAFHLYRLHQLCTNKLLVLGWV